MAAITEGGGVVAMELLNPDTGQWINMDKFATFEGGNKAIDFQDVYDWDGAQPLPGQATREEATVKRLFGRNVKDIYATLDRWTPTEAKVTRIMAGQTISYVGWLASVEAPNTVAGSSDAAWITFHLRLKTDLA